MPQAAPDPLPRADVPLAERWDAESVFPSQEAFDAEFEAVTTLLDRVADFHGHLGDSPSALADWFDFSQELTRRAKKLGFYGLMSQACDNQDQAASALAARGDGLVGRVISELAFGEPELLAVGRDTLDRWIKQEPRLADYAHHVDDLFRRQPHVRSAEVEEILGALINPFRSAATTAALLTNADLKFEPAVGSDGEQRPVAQSSIRALLASPDRETRRAAYDSYTDGYLAFKNTLASNLSAALKLEILRARQPRYPSALEASLFENNVPVAVFHNLIDTFHKNLPTWHRYWRLRRKALGVAELRPYDIWAPLASSQPDISFEQAMDWIGKGLAPLGGDYVETMLHGVLEQRWVDRSPNQGKRQGAFSFGTPDTRPFIMMSFTGRIESMSTLAHELGHSMHSWLTWRNQPYVYSGHSLFVAEVASNFNQAMTRAWLLANNADREFQIGLLEEALYNFHRYFFIMPTLARFELETHQRLERGEATPASALNALMADLFEEGYGGEMVIDRDRVGITWATFDHLYMPFYVYQYATGIAAANALSRRVLRGDESAAQDYLRFLKTGSAEYPLDALKIAGVDMAAPDAVNEAFEVLSGYVDRLEELVAG